MLPEWLPRRSGAGSALLFVGLVLVDGPVAGDDRGAAVAPAGVPKLTLFDFVWLVCGAGSSPCLRERIPFRPSAVNSLALAAADMDASSLCFGLLAFGVEVAESFADSPASVVVVEDSPAPLLPDAGGLPFAFASEPRDIAVIVARVIVIRRVIVVGVIVIGVIFQEVEERPPPSCRSSRHSSFFFFFEVLEAACVRRCFCFIRRCCSSTRRCR